MNKSELIDAIATKGDCLKLMQEKHWMRLLLLSLKR
jgi:nucleoid DNA-binding protein